MEYKQKKKGGNVLKSVKKLENKRILAISTSATLVTLSDSRAVLNDMAAEFPLT